MRERRETFMANLVIKNNTGTASSITFDNKSGSDWKIINNNGTFTLNGKSTNWLTISDTGIAKFEGRVAIKMEPDKSGDFAETYAASALSVNGFILAYNGNIRAIKDSDDTVMIWIKNNKGSVSLLADGQGRYGLLDRLHGTDGTWMLYYDTANARQQQNATHFTGTPSVANSTYWPALHFTSSNVEESFMGRISYGLSSDKDKTTYDVNRFYFQQYSFKEGTKTKMDKEGSGDSAYNPYERFRLPATEPGITGKHTYDILTTKPTTDTYTIGRLRLTSTTDGAVDKDNEAALIIGNRAGEHLVIDTNEIIAKDAATTAGSLYLNTGNAGHVHIGTGGLSVGDTEYSGTTYKLVSYGPIRAQDGNISAYSSTATERSLYAENGEGKVSLVVGSGGRRGIYNTLPNSKSHWMLYYDPTNERQQQTATYFTGTPYVANSTYMPTLWFTSSNKEEVATGRIIYVNSGTSDSTKYDWGRFCFDEYSYTANTKTRLDYRERYLLPKVTTGLGANKDYEILTTKNLVKIEQGGTNASTAAGARQNINYIGTNPITTTTNDTHEKWAALGTGIAYYNKTGQLNG